VAAALEKAALEQGRLKIDMRIIQQGQETSLPSPGPASGPRDLPAAPGSDRLDALEKAVHSILEKIQRLEEKMAAPAPSPEAPPPAPIPAVPAVALDVEAVKKGLLTKMWKHLNNERPRV
jgi:hypothetical protein